ncbi:arsinothricin resistance N-acetyltransferase ArsN1 family B [Tunturibacter empetritectus]|uniref:Phosphinothricin acetyltransferase n=1 Tax=Tunturiibacter empetritectus TaxID=3069691 RepID=A0A7W8INJ4_9BACT|nr:arsinothricin resistance N-acetyltransferase ArsN1 family B [Edaphobacter lichenicola]MBB5319433.1 phosphinothricin acetyltransferase [Edaphobacter lichenicola]
MIRQATVSDSTQLCDIYNQYVLETTITFEEQAVTSEDMAQRIQDTLQNLPWLVWEEGAQVLGFCYASKWKGRCAYRHSVESTVYVRPQATRLGIGSQLYRALLADLRHRQLHTVIGGIALPNVSSVAFHEKFGFEKVAQFRQVGNKFDQWIDVGYWQLLLTER